MRKVGFILALSAFGFVASPFAAQADSLLNQISTIARERAAGAQQKAQQVQATLAQAKEQKIREAIKIVQTAQNAAENAKSSLLQDLANGKAAVVNQLNCIFENVKTSSTVQGTLSLQNDAITDNKFIRIGSLLPGEAGSQGLAIEYSAGKGPNGYGFSLVDLNNGNKIVRSGSWSDLGLANLTAHCDHSQAIVTIQSGVPEVQTDKVIKDLTSNTTNAIHEGASDIARAAKAAVANSIH